MTKNSSSEMFAMLYSKHHLELLRYVLTLLPDRHQAEDVVQETARCLWQKFDEYDPARSFGSWARGFAYLEVLKVRKRQAVRGKYFSDQLIDTLAEERPTQEDRWAAQREALPGCLAKLDPPSRQLLISHYGGEVSLQQLAEEQGKSLNALYSLMHRIRQKLMECLNKAIRLEKRT